MNLLAHAALLIAAVAHPQHHHHQERHRLGPVRVEPNASAYCPGSSGSRMADGRSVYFGAVASNRYRLGTLLRFERAIHGRHWFRVRDTGSSIMSLDVWMPDCGEAIRFGRRTIRYRVQGG